MSEDEDDAGSIFEFLEKCSDTTLLLNKIHPYVTKIRSKTAQAIIEALIQSVMKLSNDFRSLVKYMNIMKELDMDSDGAPDWESIPPDEIYL